MIDPKIETFLVLARVANYTETSKILNITQPAISQHIKYLEQTFGCKLFNRNTKKVQLTNDGKKFYKYAQKLYLINQELNHSMMHLQHIEKKMYIGSTRTMAEDIVPDILEQFHQIYPFISFNVIIDNANTITDLLNKKEIALALIDGPIDKCLYETYKLKDDLLYVISAKSNPLSQKKYVKIEDILNQPLIAREPGSSSRKIFENSLLNMGYSFSDFNTIIEVNSVRFAKKMVIKNMGISIISFERIRHEIEHDLLNYYEIEGMQSKRDCNIVYLKDSRNIDFITQFIEIAKKTDIITPKKLPTKPW